MLSIEAFRQVGVAAVVWDRAGGHRANLTRAVEIKQVVQPAYSPELNPAERVFEEVRRAIEGRVQGAAVPAHLKVTSLAAAKVELQL